MVKYNGSIKKLKELVAKRELTGNWSYRDDEAKHVFKAKNGAILNWWPRTGSVHFQGKNTRVFEGIFLKPLSILPAQRNSISTKPRLFVRGHNRETRDRLELALRRAGLNSLIIEKVSGGPNTFNPARCNPFPCTSACGSLLPYSGSEA
jgi:hypothetical protein